MVAAAISTSKRVARAKNPVTRVFSLDCSAALATSTRRPNRSVVCDARVVVPL
jgi:hypothetical protein